MDVVCIGSFVGLFAYMTNIRHYFWDTLTHLNEQKKRETRCGPQKKTNGKTIARKLTSFFLCYFKSISQTLFVAHETYPKLTIHLKDHFI